MYSVDDLMSIVCAKTGINLTEEQREFAKDITVPKISFSDPGTGKTATAVIAIIIAQLYHQVPGNKINAMSYTKEATAEISARYGRMCKKCQINPSATFNTFHSICYSIIRDKFKGFTVKHGVEYARDLPVMYDYLIKADPAYENVDMMFVRRVLEAINNLNSRLCYDEDKVRASYVFKNLEMNYEVFYEVRKNWFILGLMSQKIVQGDIPLYALYILLKDENLCKKYRDKYRIMIVDEFQDLTALNLEVLSLIAQNLVVIGDMKQQIYGFNGACATIADEYLAMYPNAKICKLTKSFRCKDEIAEVSTEIVRPNDNNVEVFKGMGQGGSVETVASSEMDLREIIADIKEQKLYTEDSTGVETMFIYRNNISITPIAEELFRQRVPFRVKAFKKLYQLPMFGVMCEYIDLAINDRNIDYLKKLHKLMPEFKQFRKIEECPVFMAIKQSRKGLLSVPYQFQEESSYEIINALKRVKQLYDKGALCSQLFNAVEGIYEKYILEGKWWQLEYPREFYYGMAGPIINSKTYQVMLNDEEEKEKQINNCIGTGTGIRCYTMHTSKGLEADNVYILDCDSRVFPNDKVMERYSKKGCDFEAALNLRNERNLLFVGITRAKSKVVISYNEDLTKLVSEPFNTGYEYLDNYYKYNARTENDIPAFLAMLNMKGK